MQMKTKLASIVLLVMFAACAIQTLPNLGEQIGAYLNQLTVNQRFSGSVLVAQASEILLSKGYGMADIENQVPNTPQTRFRIHWITMPFTAMAIVMLQVDGKLDIQDLLCQYLPNCPDYWQGITIHHFSRRGDFDARSIRTGLGDIL